MRFNLGLGLIAISATLSLAEPTLAKVTVGTYVGKVLDGIDSIGLFGPAGSDLSGLNYKAIYTVNDSASGTTFGQSPAYSYLSGPATSAIFEMNGVKINIPAGENSDVVRWGGVSSPFSEVSHQADIPNLSLYDLLQSFANRFTSDHNFEGSLEYTTQNHDIQLGRFSKTQSSPLGYIVTYADLTISSVEVSDVPEPSAWALMLLGMIAVGCAVRMRTISKQAAC